MVLDWAVKRAEKLRLEDTVKNVLQYKHVSLQEIAEIVFRNTEVDLRIEEAKTLRDLHIALFKDGVIDKVIDMLNFCNFNRDCVCSMEQIFNVFVQFKVIEKVGPTRMAVLL